MLTWELIPEENATKVILTNVGIENFADAGAAFAMENYVAGWQEIVEGVWGKVK